MTAIDRIDVDLIVASGDAAIRAARQASRTLPIVMATSGVIFAAAYGLRALQRVLFERFDTAKNGALTDLTGRERVVMAAFAVAISEHGRSQLMRWTPATDWPKLRVVRCGVDPAFLAAPPAASRCSGCRASSPRCAS